jgi:citrate synthase
MNKTHSPKKKKEEKKSNNTFTLQEFTKKDDDKAKKWVSKRTEDKKKSLGVETCVKRKFSPRLPPYKTLKKVNSKESNINVKDDILFPSLK